MKRTGILAILLICISYKNERKTTAISSKYDCIIPAYSNIPQNGFKNEDSISVREINQLR